jgi:hypothetical protein
MVNGVLGYGENVCRIEWKRMRCWISVAFRRGAGGGGVYISTLTGRGTLCPHMGATVLGTALLPLLRRYLPYRLGLLLSWAGLA